VGASPDDENSFADRNASQKPLPEHMLPSFRAGVGASPSGVASSGKGEESVVEIFMDGGEDAVDSEEWNRWKVGVAQWEKRRSKEAGLEDGAGRIRVNRAQGAIVSSLLLRGVFPSTKEMRVQAVGALRGKEEEEDHPKSSEEAGGEPCLRIFEAGQNARDSQGTGLDADGGVGANRVSVPAWAQSLDLSVSLEPLLLEGLQLQLASIAYGSKCEGRIDDNHNENECRGDAPGEANSFRLVLRLSQDACKLNEEQQLARLRLCKLPQLVFQAEQIASAGVCQQECFEHARPKEVNARKNLASILQSGLWSWHASNGVYVQQASDLRHGSARRVVRLLFLADVPLSVSAMVRESNENPEPDPPERFETELLRRLSVISETCDESVGAASTKLGHETRQAARSSTKKACYSSSTASSLGFDPHE
jgi:hypothetical protein